MTLREVLLQMTTAQRREFAAACGTTTGYLRKLAYGQCLPSGTLAAKLVAREPRITYADLFENRHVSKARA